jgi:hypothetical protein
VTELIAMKFKDKKDLEKLSSEHLVEEAYKKKHHRDY